MRHSVAHFLLGIALIVGCRTSAPVANAPPPSPAGGPLSWEQTLAQQNTDATIYQHSSAEVYRLYQQCYELARIRLDANLALPRNLPPAVVVDIDETVLDNSPYNVKAAWQGHAFDPKTWNEWVLMASAKALPGALEFLRYASKQGCTVFYITNRNEAERNATIKNLFELGFPDADEAHVMCMDGSGSDKTKRRGRVMGTHTIVLLVGDQLRDFDEMYKDRSIDMGRPTVDANRDMLRDRFILLPNPMYGTWLDAAGGKVDSLKLEKKAAFLKQRAY